MTDDRRAELAALHTRAACEEARRQSALARGDRQAAADAAAELARLHTRACDLERQQPA